MRQALTTRFYNMLWTATADRDKFQGMPALDDEPAWVKHERHVMLAVVNAERVKRGLPPVGEAAIRQGEIVGHPSYGRQLAEHCAGLAVGE